MHKPSLPQLVYNAIFPKARTNDPASFAAHISRNLVPEVRIETSTFYGTLDCIEAQYPGLDYSHPPHRMRLGRFPWHKKLFKAFDDLGLTEGEIASLCRWEGTKSARERYERDEGVTVRDTTADDVSVYVRPTRPSVQIHSLDEELPPAPEPETTNHTEQVEARMKDTSEEFQTADEDEESSEDEVESYGVELNQRLLEATAARDRGADVSLDEDWEQWLKEAVESGGYSDMIDAIRAGHPLGSAFYGTSSGSRSTQFSTSGPSRPRPESMPGRLLISAQSSLAAPVTAPNTTLRPPSDSTAGTAR
ncbi:hypothetical protein FQN54_005582 [Arachnomyces sp. PD_36]|nr:hypothetical protein FQN54_005582 [Arachnomyces sp. PD_36]